MFHTTTISSTRLLSLFLVGCKLCSAFTSIGTNNILSTSFPISILSLTAEHRQKAHTTVERADSPPTIGAVSLAIALGVATTVFVQPIPSALATPPTLNEAIVEVSATSYPILRALDPVAFREYSTNIGDLFLHNDKINPDKLGKSIELGIDALDSAPSEKIADFNLVLKNAYADVSVDSCRMVPLPPKTVVEDFEKLASEKVDPDKLKAFTEKWSPSLEALKKTDESICLPPTRSTLDKLALAQADLGRAFGKAETKAFFSYTGPFLKSSITPAKALSLVNHAKTLAPGASAQAKKDFAAAAKKAESASQLELARNKVAELKAQQAANKAALANKK